MHGMHVTLRAKLPDDYRAQKSGKDKEVADMHTLAKVGGALITGCDDHPIPGDGNS